MASPAVVDKVHGWSHHEGPAGAHYFTPTLHQSSLMRCVKLPGNILEYRRAALIGSARQAGRRADGAPYSSRRVVLDQWQFRTNSGTGHWPISLLFVWAILTHKGLHEGVAAARQIPEMPEDWPGSRDSITLCGSLDGCTDSSSGSRVIELQIEFSLALCRDAVVPDRVRYLFASQLIERRMSATSGIAMPPKESLSASAPQPPQPVNGRTSFDRRTSSSSALSAIGASNEPSAYRGPFGHVGNDPDDDPAAATTGVFADPSQFCGGQQTFVFAMSANLGH